jgi:hypothetical protein
MIQGTEAYHEVSSEVFSFPGYFIFRRNDGIIHIQFEIGFVGDIEDAKNQVRIFDQLRGGQKALILAICEEDNSFTRESREYVAGEEVSAIVGADAFVVKGLASRILGNGYLRINKPKRPTRLFNSSSSAVQWLRQFQD